MARQKGSLSISGTIEPLAGGALDARTVVPTEADLIIANNFPYPYVGLFTVVKATGDMWVLLNEDVTSIDHWHKIGSGGANNIVEGYYNDTDGKFYEEDTYTTEIEGADDTLYISLDTNLLYRFDGTDFIIMSSKATTRTLTQAEFDALPQSEKDNGTTYYITDSSAVQGISIMGNRFDKANIYTEDERMIGSYIGKPLYQMTFGATVSAEYSLVSGVFMRGSYSLIDAGLDIEDMPFADGFYTDGSNTLSFIDVWYDKADSNLYFIVYLEREDINAEFTIRYTKASDGTIAVGTGNDYSTDEQIIGTWIDGNKLYQKTIEVTFTQREMSISIDPAYLIKNIYGGVYNSVDTDFIPIGYGIASDSIVSIYNNSSNNTLQFENAYYSSRGKGVVTIQYTKTTD